MEILAIERAKKLFGADHVNVQPHSGANANTAVYFAFLKPGDTIMGMNLSQGGHLSHGSPVNISGSYYNVVPYGVDHDTETIDYDALAQTAAETKPKIIVAGASAYSRIPGNIALSIALAYCSLHIIRPPRGPRSVLCVVVVTISA